MTSLRPDHYKHNQSKISICYSLINLSIILKMWQLDTCCSLTDLHSSIYWHSVRPHYLLKMLSFCIAYFWFLCQKLRVHIVCRFKSWSSSWFYWSSCLFLCQCHYFYYHCSLLYLEIRDGDSSSSSFWERIVLLPVIFLSFHIKLIAFLARSVKIVVDLDRNCIEYLGFFW